jgi:predicted nuclease of predicted toxin-antitoxin system
MRVLLDENLDQRLAHSFDEDFTVVSVGERGWKSIKNGQLLHLAETEFDVFITMDKGIEHQQNWRRLDLAIVIVSARTSFYLDVEPLIPQIQNVLRTIRPGQLYHIP